MRLGHTNGLTGLNATRMRFGLGAQAEFLRRMAEEAARHRKSGMLLNLGDHSHKMPAKSLGDHVATWLA